MAHSRAHVLGLLVALAVVTGCGPRAGAGVAPRATEWSFGAAEHVSLWYHGMALARAATEEERADTTVLPLYRAGYAESITTAKEEAGAAETELDRRAAEFGAAFQDTAYVFLEFLPLYFLDSSALFAAIRIWDQAQGNPRVAQTQSAFQAITFLSNIFPRSEQRHLIAQWGGVLEEEARVFYRAHWERQFLRARQTGRAVEADWRALAPVLRPYLERVNLQGGEAFLVPALGPEGRIVPSVAGDPRAALLAPPADSPRDAVLSFLHEILYPFVSAVIEQNVMPTTVADIGERRLSALAAVRGGAVLLEHTDAVRLDEYHRFYLRAGGHDIPDTGVAAAFEAAFPLPDELESALRAAIVEAATSG
jgi:hypothetical protein